MFYELAEDGLDKVPAHMANHQARLREFHGRGVLLMAGPTLAYLPWREAGMAAAGPLLMLLLPRGFCERRPGLAAGCAAVLAVVPGIAALLLLLGEANPYGY